MLVAFLLPAPVAWLPLVARSVPQRSRAVAYLSASVDARTRPTRTITVELATEDASDFVANSGGSLAQTVGRVRLTGAPVTVELIADDASEGSAADDGRSLAQPGRAPLLTREQEVALAREIQTLTQWRQVRSSLAVGGAAPSDEVWAAAIGCTSEELQSQLRRSYAARCQLIESNLRLVYSVANMAARRSPQVQLQLQHANLQPCPPRPPIAPSPLRHCPPLPPPPHWQDVVLLQDVVQDGVLGLMRAADRFDPERGHRFSTYAVWWIRQARARTVPTPCTHRARTVPTLCTHHACAVLAPCLRSACAVA